jgi:hypothetical protein
MKRGNRSRIRKSSPKLSLNLPDLDQAKSAVLNSLPSKESQRGYRHAIDEFVAWYCSEPRLSFSKAVVTRYRIHLESRQLAPGTINGRLAAVRRLAYEAADAGLLTPDLAAVIRRVKGPKNLGVRLGNWLTTDQARTLWQVPDASTEIERCSVSSWAADCAGERPQSWIFLTFNRGTNTRPSSIWSAKHGMSGRCPFRTGSRTPSIPGSCPLA